MSNVKHYQQPKRDELKSIGNQGKEKQILQMFVLITLGKERGGNGGLVAKLCQTLVTPWTPACQAPLPMEFSRQEYWSGLPFPSPGDLPDTGIEPASPVSRALQANSLPAEPLRKGSPVNPAFFPSWGHGRKGLRLSSLNAWALQ